MLDFAFEQQRRKKVKWRLQELREQDLRESVASLGLQSGVEEG